MALTNNRQVDRYVDQEMRALPVAMDAHIYKGALVGLSGGYARPLEAGDIFAGVAYEEMDNTAGQPGDLVVRVFTQGDFEHELAGADRVHNFGPIFALDDQTLTVNSSGHSFVGHQIDVVGDDRIVVRIQVAPMPLAGGTMAGPLVSAGLKHQVVTKVSATSVAIGVADLGGVIVVTGTTASSLNLPSAAEAGPGAWCTFIKTGVSGVLTVTPAGSDSIDSAGSHTLMGAAHDTVTIVCDGMGWHVVAAKIAT